MITPDSTDSVLRDPARLAALAESGLAPGRQSVGDSSLDRLASLAGKILRAPLALVSLVEKERQVFQGMDGPLPEPWACRRETPLEYSFCQHVVTTGKPLIVRDAVNDPLVAENLAVANLDVASYLGVPLVTPEGHVLGSLCVIDVVPRPWTAEDLDTLTGLAAFANTELQLRRTSQKMADAGHDRARAVDSVDGTHLLVHDLRTPLNSMLLGLQTLPLLGELNEEQREALELAERGGQALMSLVNDMLDLSAAEASGGGAPALHLAPLAPADVLDSAMRQVTNLAKERGIRLRAEPPAEGLRATAVDGDAGKLIRALVNLLGNAIKFTPANGSVTASVQADDEGVAFAVRDTGRGIDPADHERIFDRFVRVGQTEDGHGGRSSGLGLAFCRMVAEAHGGEITVASELGQGSEFCLRLPGRRAN